MPTIVRVTQLAFLVLTCASVFYTTKCLLQSLVVWMSRFPNSLWSGGFTDWRHPPNTIHALSSDALSHLDPATLSLLANGVYSPDPAASLTLSTLHSDSSDLGPQLFGSYNTSSAYTVSQQTLLSKAFAHSLHPTRIVPYFYRAERTFDEDDVTITTLVTSNRFRVFKQLVDRYRGESCLY